MRLTWMLLPLLLWGTCFAAERAIEKEALVKANVDAVWTAWTTS